ncbi:MAG: PhzF family phenazine biosynthesis protein [Anaerolineae bacterium]|nr:PhzF family phenazine biosynthesis protein [Anaerolineae bacterium]
MSLTLYQVDAFTDRPFTGNPAAVVLLQKPAEDGWMQQVAAEMNLSETAFLLPQTDGFNLRWFTPAVEVELCGHATLASAHVLWETGHLLPEDEARFFTLSGLLLCRRRGDWIEMDFPSEAPGPSEAPAGMLAALGLEAAVYVGRNRFDYLVEVESEEDLSKLRPDPRALAASVPGTRGVIVTARSHGTYDFVSRFFAPAAGIDEDPVTGSAHCALGPYWGARLGREAMLAYQASSRGGVVQVRLAGPRVILGGQAVTVLRGTLTAVS